MSGIYKKLKYKMAMASREAMFKAGMGNHLLKNRPGKRMLIYHGIDKEGDTSLNSRFIRLDDFEQQLTYFKDHFHVVSLSDYYEKETHPEKLTVCLTFDDGYANFLQYALPVLEKLELPATLCVTTVHLTPKRILWPDFFDLAAKHYGKPIAIDGEVFSLHKKGKYQSDNTHKLLSQLCMERGYAFVLKAMNAFPYTLDFEPYADQWKLLTEDELKAVAASPLVTIGAHGMVHESYRYADRYFALEAMEQSKKWLEATIDKEVKAMAFPFGHYTEQTVKDALSLGYKHVLAVDYNRPDDQGYPELKERLGINPHISWNNQLACILKGSYQ